MNPVRINPIWKDAPYEIVFIKGDGSKVYDPYPHRFNEPWPSNLTTYEEVVKWIFENSIPKFIIEKEQH